MEGGWVCWRGREGGGFVGIEGVVGGGGGLVGEGG